MIRRFWVRIPGGVLKLSQLRYLVAVADHGTVRGASRAIFVAQPAVSRAIAALEEELRAPLFERERGRLVLTRLGNDVVAHARRALAEVDAIEQRAAAFRRQQSTQLRLATTPSLEELATIHLLPLLDDGVRVTITRVDDPSAGAELVRTGAVDLALSDLPVEGDLASVPLLEEEIVLACPPGTPVSPLPVGELSSVALVLPSDRSRRRDEFEAFFATTGIVPQVSVESDDRLAWTAHVLGGAGCAFRYRSQVERLAHTGIVARSLRPPVTRRVAVVHLVSCSSPLVRALVDRLSM